MKKNSDSKRWLDILLRNSGYTFHHLDEDADVYSRVVGDLEFFVRVIWLREEGKSIWEFSMSCYHDFPKVAPDATCPKGLVQIDRIRKDDIEQIHFYELKLMNAINMIKQ